MKWRVHQNQNTEDPDHGAWLIDDHEGQTHGQTCDWDLAVQVATTGAHLARQAMR